MTEKNYSTTPTTISPTSTIKKSLYYKKFIPKPKTLSQISSSAAAWALAVTAIASTPR
jgi:hypothetical protein